MTTIWAVPIFDKKTVDKAGKILVAGTADLDEWDSAFAVIDNHRASHNFPLNTFQVTLRAKARQIDRNAIVAQRIKRLFSIHHKLERFPSMRFSQMQDIGGCRAIVMGMPRLRRLVESYEHGNLKHHLNHKDDYVAAPQRSGYRGIHLIYRYYSDKKTTYNGLKIEMQLRSIYQHAWATAVETVGTFTSQALKSSRGEEDWLRFFSLMGTAIAHMERSPLVPDTPNSIAELHNELTDYARRLNVVERLVAYGEAVRTIGAAGLQDAHYFLLKLDTSAKVVEVEGFRANEPERASQRYLELEREAMGSPTFDAVLVSVESLSALRRAYPNYFFDSTVFVSLVERAIAEPRGPFKVRTFRAK